jgi:ribonuclease E
MAKKMLIDATHAEETRVVVVDGKKVEEFDFESLNKRQLAGNIYLAKVTRVEPSLQAAFVDYGGNRHGFLAFSEIHPDYYQIPVEDRKALLEEERAFARRDREEDDAKDDAEAKKGPRRGRGRGKSAAAKSENNDAVAEGPRVESSDVAGMDVVDLSDVADAGLIEGFEETTSGDAAEVTQAPEAQTDVPGSSVSEEVKEDIVVAEQEAETQSAASGDTPTEDGNADEISEETADDAATDANNEEDASDDTSDDTSDNSAQSSDIESVSVEDTAEEIRPRKPRNRRYKIQEVIKVRQILLVQVVKEERGNKGAALTTYLSLAGRYSVLMPNTARGGGISRKITNAVDRKRLKTIAQDIDVPEGTGLIVRTAGAQRTKTEINRDYEYLLRQWEEVRDLTLRSIAPAQIYEEGNLIKRSIRDLYTRDVEEVYVEGEIGYRTAKDFMKMLMPSHAKKVQQYKDPMPLFARYQVESFMSGMFNPTVQLKSGGYIVIGITEALVAIDVNSGRATKEGSIEDTATKTNLEAAEEVARQLRLRDLAGLIVIDFIDMEDRRNNNAVEKRFKDKLKSDRARIQVGRISGFGLMEMSRQRLRPGMLEATTSPCPHCHATGLIRSDDNLALTILREVEEEAVRGSTREVLISAPFEVANYLINQKREHIALIETRYGISVRVEATPGMISPNYTIEKFKSATRVVPVATANVVSTDTIAMEEIDEADEDTEETVEATGDTTRETAGETTGETTGENGDGEDDQPKKKRRRRRRGGRGRGRRDTQNEGEDGSGSPENGDEPTAEATPASADDVAPNDTAKPGAEGQPDSAAPTADAESSATVGDASSGSDETPSGEEADVKPKKPRSRSRKPKEKPAEEVLAEAVVQAPVADAEVASDEPPEKPKKPRGRPRKKPVAEAVAETAVEAPTETSVETVAEKAPEPAPAPEPTPEPVLEVVGEAPASEPGKPAKPPRRGWWSRGE